MENIYTNNHCEAKMALRLIEKPKFIGIAKLSCPLCHMLLHCLEYNYRGNHTSFFRALWNWLYPNLYKAKQYNKKKHESVSSFIDWLRPALKEPVFETAPDFRFLKDKCPIDDSPNKLQEFGNKSDDVPIL